MTRRAGYRGIYEGPTRRGMQNMVDIEGGQPYNSTLLGQCNKWRWQMSTYTTIEAAEKLGIPQPTVSYWVRNGLVGLDYTPKSGKAVPLTDKHLRELKTVKRLREAGLSLQSIRRAAGFLRGLGFNPYSTGTFAVIEDGELVRVADTGEAMQLLQEPGQLQLISLAPDDE